MPSRLVMVVCFVAVAFLGCSVVESDPRGNWGYFENGRSIGDTSIHPQLRPWGSL